MTNQTLKTVAIIPAHLASERFERKILFPFLGFPMIEHVRRRALLSGKINDVYIATCDNEIAEVVKSYGGNVIMTGDHHINGTTRIAEAAHQIEASHIILLQGDEPLLLPSFVDMMAGAIIEAPECDAWNGTGPIYASEELDRHSFVKCAVNQQDQIMYCFRRSPSYAKFEEQQKYIRKILGIIAYRKAFLEHLVTLPQSQTEFYESIEQMRIIENGYSFQSVTLGESLPSVNEPHEADIVLDYIRTNDVQRDLIKKTFGVEI
jgi:3-deoxy-manno-octulosonate cytidylyltransferase (CMP-KDO synthetase)